MLSKTVLPIRQEREGVWLNMQTAPHRTKFSWCGYAVFELHGAVQFEKLIKLHVRIGLRFEDRPHRDHP